MEIGAILSIDRRDRKLEHIVEPLQKQKLRRSVRMQVGAGI